MSNQTNGEIKIEEGSIMLGDNVILSPLSFSKAIDPPLDLTNPEEIIKKIKLTVATLGLSSLTFCGVDDFTNEKFQEDYVWGYSVEGGELKGFQYPYNVIQCSRDNKWMFKCANIYFRIYHNIIAKYYDKEDCYTNFTIHGVDKKFNIPRSSGNPCEGFIKNGHGIKIRNKLSYVEGNEPTDDPLKLYIYCSFNENRSDICEDYMYGDSVKLTLLEQVKQANNSIDKISVYFTIFDEKEMEMVSNVNKIVMEYFNQLHKNWLNMIFIPLIDKSSIIFDIYENGDKVNYK